MTLALVGCSAPITPATTPTGGMVTLRLYASSDTLPLVNDLTTFYAQTRPQVAFEVVRGSLSTLVQALRSQPEGYLLTNHLPDEPDLLAWPLGQDAVAFITAPANPVSNLSREQLRSVYLGTLVDWQRLGGPDGGIRVLSREESSSTRAELERLLMGERLTTQAAQVAPSSEAMLASVLGVPGSIGYVSMGYLDGSVKALAVDGIVPTPATVAANQYPLRSTLFVVGFREPQRDYLAFIGWAQSEAGQRVVAMRYAPLLRP